MDLLEDEINLSDEEEMENEEEQIKKKHKRLIFTNNAWRGAIIRGGLGFLLMAGGINLMIFQLSLWPVTIGEIIKKKKKIIINKK